MPQCCRCNASGRCRGCVCAKNKRVCTSCTPGRSGRCENQPDAVSDSTQGSLSVTPAATPAATPGTMNDELQPNQRQEVTSEKPRVLWQTMALTTITTIEELTRTQTVDWNISPYSSPCSPLPFDGEQSKVEHLLGLFKTATRR